LHRGLRAVSPSNTFIQAISECTFYLHVAAAKPRSLAVTKIVVFAHQQAPISVQADGYTNTPLGSRHAAMSVSSRKVNLLVRIYVRLVSKHGVFASHLFFRHCFECLNTWHCFYIFQQYVVSATKLKQQAYMLHSARRPC
jgi:hypothetical protein